MSQYFDKFIIFLLALLVGIKFTGDFIPISLTLIYGLTMGLILIRVIFSLLSEDLKNEYNFNQIVLWVFLALIVFSISYTRSSGYAFSKLWLFFSFMLIPIFFGKIWARNYNSFVTYSYFIFLFALGYVLVFKQSYFELFLSGRIFNFTFSDANNSNVISYFFVLGIIHGVSFLTGKNKIQYRLLDLLQLSVIISGFLFLLFVGSKGALLALFGAYFMFFFMRRLRKKKSAYIVTSFLIFIVAVSILNSPSILYELLPEDVYDYLNLRILTDQDSSLSGRLLLFSSAVEGFGDGNFLQLLFGHGLGDFGILNVGYDIRAYPHNIILEILYEQGLFGVMLFFGLIFGVVFENTKIAQTTNQKTNIILITFYAFLIRSLTTGDIASNVFVFIYMYLIFQNSQYLFSDSNQVKYEQ